MKHSILSMLLLFGIGVSPALGFVGGGNIHYPSDVGNTDTQRSDTEADQSGTKGIVVDGTVQQKTANNDKSCTGVGGNTCPYHLDQLGR